jgi:hypothetical protein
MKPSFELARNAVIHEPTGDRPLNPLLTYRPAKVISPEIVWVDLPPRAPRQGVGGWIVYADDPSILSARFARFLGEFFGEPDRKLDYDVDITVGHVFALDNAGKLLTTNVLFPLSLTQDAPLKIEKTAEVLHAEVAAKIGSPPRDGHWIELDVTLRRNSRTAASGVERHVIFRDRFWFHC